jgi:hypothetical protein
MVVTSRQIPASGLWLAAAALVVVEALSALAGVHALALTVAALLAPGLALAGLLPAAVREHPLAALAAAPALGFAAVSAALITVARLGIPLTGLSTRCVLVALVLAGIAAQAPRNADRERPAFEPLEALALLAVLAVGVVLTLRVIGSAPVPGNDWAKYLLYADEVRLHGSLLIRNPFWMLGVPFREDPAIPALYGSALIMAKAPAGALAQGIAVFAVLQVLAVFAYVRAFWGGVAGLLAAALVTVVPASQDILGWHGLPNLAALALLALLLAYLGQLARDGLDRRGVVGLAVTLIGLAAAHRLSATMGVGVIGVTAVALLVSGRRRAIGDLALAAGLAIVLGLGVAADLYARQKTFGGTLPYASYLGTKLDIRLAIRDLSLFLVILTGAGLLGLVVRRRLDAALWPAAALTAVSIALSYVWLLHLPLYYARMVYFVPLAAAPVAAVALTRLRPPALAAAIAVIGLGVVLHASYRQAREVRAFYRYTSPTTLRGLDALSTRLRPGEVVVTDRCWSFLATWLLRTRTLPALLPQDIQPRAELRIAQMAQSVLDGTPAGKRRVRQFGIRYVVIDPTCPSPSGAPLTPPAIGRPVFASERLAILRLSASR